MASPEVVIPWRDQLRPFVSGLALRPILVSPVLFLLAIVWLDFGSDYGIAAQVFHENLRKQFLAGIGASVLLLQVGLVAYLLDGQKRWLVAVPARPDDPGHRIDRQMRWYLDRTWLPMLVLVGTAGVLEPWERWPFVLGLLVPMGVYFLVRRLRIAWTSREKEEGERKVPIVKVRPGMEILGHALLAVLGGTLIGVVIPNERLEGLCFLLMCWLALHGMALFLVRLYAMPDEDQRRMHRRAGISFGAFFVIYQILFILYWVDHSGELAAWAAPPALVCFLLLCQVVTVHGFLEYHFRGWYVLVVLVALVSIGVINGRPRYKLHFPGLDYRARVQLLEADFEGLYAQLLARTAELEREPTNEVQRDQVMASYHRVMEAHRSLDRRVRERLALNVGVRGYPDQPVELPDGPALLRVLEQGRFEEARLYYRLWRDATTALHLKMSSLDREVLENWKQGVAGRGEEKPKLVVLAVSGGANRSALWTTYVLDQLEQAFEKEGIAFAPHVRLITGASGGMVGAAYWVATLDEKAHRHLVSDREEYVERVARDSLTRLGHHALFLDLPTLLLPGEFERDRGVALEKAWSVNLQGALDCTFRSLARGEVEGWRPSLVFSPMLVEDGRRLLISNLYLSFLTENVGQSLANPDRENRGQASGRRPRPIGKPTRQDAYPELDEPRGLRRDRYSLSAIEFFQLFPGAEEFRLSTAVRMSATFPYFSPAVDLPTEPRRRVVDAGYYDNYGVDVAASWLYRYREWLRKNTSGVVLIQLRDSASERRRLFPDDEARFWDEARSLEWLTGPLVGLGSAREAGMSFRNDQLVQVLSDYFNQSGRAMFTTVIFEAKEEIAMSWYLTRREVERMKSGFGEEEGVASANRRALERLLRWWKSDSSSR